MSENLIQTTSLNHYQNKVKYWQVQKILEINQWQDEIQNKS
jgi:hypothetical protein